MHIAQIAPLTEAIPPKLYGGVSWLTEELIALGHEVTLFASGNSQTSARLEAVWPRHCGSTARCIPTRCGRDDAGRVYQRSAIFDFLHFHLDYYPFSLFAPAARAVRDRAARPARFARAPAGIRHLQHGAGGVDLQLAAAAVAAGALGAHGASRSARAAIGAEADQAELVWPLLGRIAPKGHRSRRAYCPALRRAGSRSRPRSTAPTRVFSTSRSSR